ncbi:hypothetical protein VTN31DRAFT_6499 [Thermomyces dupontii]|uniref:uncharacterized protein n=1 Tax=Talaromyces thermophilus TaxID=28565 RepID=UPI0037447E4C
MPATQGHAKGQAKEKAFLHLKKHCYLRAENNLRGNSSLQVLRMVAAVGSLHTSNTEIIRLSRWPGNYQGIPQLLTARRRRVPSASAAERDEGRRPSGNLRDMLATPSAIERCVSKHRSSLTSADGQIDNFIYNSIWRRPRAQQIHAGGFSVRIG